MIPKWTLPAIDGARVATDSLVRNTIYAGAQIDILCLCQQDEKADILEMKKAWGVREVFILPRKLPSGKPEKTLYYLKKILLSPHVPLTFSSFNDESLKRETSKIIKAQKYDCIVLDGLHLGVVFFKGWNFVKPQETKIIYRAHNIEADLWKKAYKEKSNPLLKLVLYFQALLVEKFERIIIDNSDGIAPIAQEDADVIEEMNPVKQKMLIPLGLNFDNPLKQELQDSTKFLFIGRLDWPPNRDGLEWILKEVWPTVIKQRPQVKLKIVGSGNKSWLNQYAHLPGLEIVGFVDNIKDAYHDCQFTIVPITYGSGTRIKVIEAFSMNRRLISTKMGVQGANLRDEDYVLAESKTGWIKTLTEISLDSTALGQLALSRDYMASQFGERNIGKRFYDWLTSL